MNVDMIRNEFGSQIAGITDLYGEISISASPDVIVPLCRFLKQRDEFAFDFLSDLCGVDCLPASPRFFVVYHLYSTKHRHRLRIKAAVDESDPVIDSCVPVWPGAEWHERECFDLFGIIFRGHPDLRRILLPEDFQGHPLRKDFPLEGQEQA